MAGSISTLGIGSGLQLQDILDQLREIDQEVIEKKKDKVETYNAQINEFTSVNNSLLGMKSAALDLSLSSNYLKRTVESSDEKVLTATVLDGAVVNSQSVTVDRLATKSSWMSAGADAETAFVYVPTSQESTTGVVDPAVGSVVSADGVMVINSGDGDPVTSITVNVTAGMTMDDLVDAINVDDENGGAGSPSANVIAETYVQDGSTHLRIRDTGGDTGEAGRVRVATNDTDLTMSAPSMGLAFQVGDETFSLDVAADTSLAQLADLINDASDNPGVTASIIDDGSASDSFKFVLQANVAGSENEIIFLSQLPDIVLAAQGETADGLNAQITIDNISYQRQTNTIDDIVAGVTLNLKGDGISSLSVETSEEEVVGMINSLVTAYNEVAQSIDTQINYDDTTGEFGLLAGTTIRDIPFRLQNLMTTTYEGSEENIERTYDEATNSVVVVDNNIYTVFDLGLEYQRDGSVTIDQKKLSEVVTEFPDIVCDFFTGTTSSITIPQLNSIAGVADAGLDSIVDADGTMVIQYGSGLDEEFTIDLSAGDTLDDLVAAINADAENVGNGVNGRLLTASTYTSDGQTFLRLDSANSSGDGAVTALSITTNDTTLTFGASTNRTITDTIEGFADKVNINLRSLTNAVGTVAAEKTAAQQRIDDLNSSIEGETARLDKRYDLMAKQFIALDSYMSQMTSVSNFLTGQFASLSDGWGQVGGKN